MNTLDQMREERPWAQVCSLETVDNAGYRWVSKRHFYREQDQDPLWLDLDQGGNQYAGYIVRPSTLDDAIHWTDGFPFPI